MTEIICTKCERPIAGFTVYDDHMNPYHPACAPAEFKEQAKAERQEFKASHIGVRKQRKIDALWNRRARLVKKRLALLRDMEGLMEQVGKVEADLKTTDPDWEAKLADLQTVGSEPEEEAAG